MKNEKQGIWKRNLLATAILTPALLVVGCSDDNDDIPIPGTTVSGVAYDGYLANARVCVDVNLNKACDAGEPATITNANGAFSLIRLTSAQAQMPLVLEATAETTDSDTGATVDPDLKFTAPAGTTAISAFSTIVQSRVESLLASGTSGTMENIRDLAAQSLADDLGLGGIDLLSYDPISVKSDSDASDTVRREAAILHITNQVLTQQIVDLRPQAEAIGGGSQDEAAYGATIKNLDPVDVKNAAENDTSGLSTTDLIDTDKGSVTSVTPPPVPTATDIADAADEDDAADQATEDKVDGDTDGTGGTGGTGGSGGVI